MCVIDTFLESLLRPYFALLCFALLCFLEWLDVICGNGSPSSPGSHSCEFISFSCCLQIMPTLDYYGFEHEDAITGFVAEYDSQIFNRYGVVFMRGSLFSNQGSWWRVCEGQICTVLDHRPEWFSYLW